MAPNQRVIAVETPEGRSIALPVVVVGQEQQVSSEGPPQLGTALAAVEEFAADFKKAMLKVAPTKATVEFGITFALQAGKLTALFVDGRAEGAVTVTLEWDREDGTSTDADPA